MPRATARARSTNNPCKAVHDPWRTDSISWLPATWPMGRLPRSGCMKRPQKSHRGCWVVAGPPWTPVLGMSASRGNVGRLSSAKDVGIAPNKVQVHTAEFATETAQMHRPCNHLQVAAKPNNAYAADSCETMMKCSSRAQAAYVTYAFGQVHQS